MGPQHRQSLTSVSRLLHIAPSTRPVAQGTPPGTRKGSPWPHPDCRDSGTSGPTAVPLRRQPRRPAALTPDRFLTYTRAGVEASSASSFCNPEN